MYACPHANPATGEPCRLLFLHNAAHRDAHGTEWGGRAPHGMPRDRQSDALWTGIPSVERDRNRTS
jgi:hypothetical protein